MFACIDREGKISKIIKISRRQRNFKGEIEIMVLVITESGERIYELKGIILDIIYRKTNISNITKLETKIMYEMIKCVFEDTYFYNNKDI